MGARADCGQYTASVTTQPITVEATMVKTQNTPRISLPPLLCAQFYTMDKKHVCTTHAPMAELLSKGSITHVKKCLEDRNTEDRTIKYHVNFECVGATDSAQVLCAQITGNLSNNGVTLCGLDSLVQSMHKLRRKRFKTRIAQRYRGRVAVAWRSNLSGHGQGIFLYNWRKVEKGVLQTLS